MDPQEHLHAWQQFRTAQRLNVRGIVADPARPTRRDFERWVEQHRYAPAIPATPEVLALARRLSVELREPIGGTLVYRGVAYQLPPSRGPGRNRTSQAGEITRSW